jgi:hypothetical protein
MFCCVVFDVGSEEVKAYVQLAHNMMRSFNLFNPDTPSVLYAFGVNEKKVNAMIDDNINVVADPIFNDVQQMFIYRSQLVAQMIDEWGWCILLDNDTLIRKPIDGLIKLVDCPKPTMAAYKRPIAEQGWNCGVMAMNSGAQKVLERWHYLQQKRYKELKKKDKKYPLCYEQDAWVAAANHFNFPLTDYGREFNSMSELQARGGNGKFGDGAIWHSKSGHKSEQWKKETNRIMGLCDAAK